MSREPELKHQKKGSWGDRGGFPLENGGVVCRKMEKSTGKRASVDPCLIFHGSATVFVFAYWQSEVTPAHACHAHQLWSPGAKVSEWNSRQILHIPTSVSSNFEPKTFQVLLKEHIEIETFKCKKL